MNLPLKSTVRDCVSVSTVRLLNLFALTLTLGACNGALVRPDVFEVTPSQAYQLLSNVDFNRKGDRPFGNMKVTVTGEPDKSVTWTAEWVVCTIGIAPVETTKSQISVSCNGGDNERGVEGMLVGGNRLEVIEQIDAALKQRPYNEKLADGTTAFGWPADQVHHAGMSEARGDALKSMADSAQQDEDLKNQAARLRANPAASSSPQSDVPFGQPDPNAGKPTDNTGN